MNSTSFKQSEPCGITGCKHPKYVFTNNRQKKNYACLFWKIQAQEEEQRLLAEETQRIQSKMEARSVKIFSSKDLMAAQKGYRFAGITNGADKLIPSASSEKKAELQKQLDSLPVETPSFSKVIEEEELIETTNQFAELSITSSDPDEIIESLTEQMVNIFQSKPIITEKPVEVQSPPVIQEKEFTANELITEFYSNRKNLSAIFHNKNHLRLILVLENHAIQQFQKEFPKLVQTPILIDKGVIHTINNERIVLINYKQHLKVNYQEMDYYKIYEVSQEPQSRVNDGFFYINALLSFGDHVDFGIFYDEEVEITDRRISSYYRDNHHIGILSNQTAIQKKKKWNNRIDYDYVISDIVKYRLNDQERKDYLNHYTNDLFIKFGF